MPGKKSSQSLMFSPRPGAATVGAPSHDFGSNSAMIGKLAAASHADAASAGIDVSKPAEKSIDDQIYDDFVAHLTGGDVSQSLQ